VIGLQKFIPNTAQANFQKLNLVSGLARAVSMILKESQEGSVQPRPREIIDVNIAQWLQSS
jgi:hypothetical protein